MRRWRGLRALRFVVFAAAAAGLVGVVVMSLWNWLAPPLFGAAAIGFWQALGLFLLVRLLVGFRGGGRPHWRHRMRERWEQMTPEERERLRAGLHGRCGRGGARADGAVAP